MLRTVETGVLLVLIGLVVTGFGVHQLGTARAALKWPAARQPRIGRSVATLELVVGVVVIAVGVAWIGAQTPVDDGLRIIIAAVLGGSTLVCGLLIATKITDRVELNALIRPSPLYRTTAPGPGGHHQSATPRMPGTTPGGRPDGQPTGQPDGSAGIRPTEPDGRSDDPTVPADAQPGWVYRDADDNWYLTVTTGPGYRLVRLPDFELAPPDPTRQLTAAGSVELSVWPL